MKSYAAMNERMLEIKALNLSLSLLYTLILVSWSRFIFLFTQEKLQHDHRM